MRFPIWLLVNYGTNLYNKALRPYIYIYKDKADKENG